MRDALYGEMHFAQGFIRSCPYSGKPPLQHRAFRLLGLSLLSGLCRNRKPIRPGSSTGHFVRLDFKIGLRNPAAFRKVAAAHAYPIRVNFDVIALAALNISVVIVP